MSPLKVWTGLYLWARSAKQGAGGGVQVQAVNSFIALRMGRDSSCVFPVFGKAGSYGK